MSKILFKNKIIKVFGVKILIIKKRKNEKKFIFINKCNKIKNKD